MKKSLLPFLVVLLIVGAFGYYFFSTKKEKAPSQTKVESPIKQKKETVVEKIKDLIAQNTSLKCTYEIDGTKITTYIKGKNRIRSTVETKEGVNESIFANNKIYSWDQKTKEGIMMSVDLIKNRQNQATKIEDPEKQIEELERLKAKCVREIFPDSIFNPPTDVKFQDFDKLQELMRQGN